MIIPAIIPGQLSDIETALAPLNSRVQRAQIDVCDGMFVEAVTWPYREEEQWAEIEQLASGLLPLPYREELTYEAHLMVQDPDRVGALFASAGVSTVIAHIETVADVDGFFHIADMWRAAGAKGIGLALLMETPLSRLETYIDHVDVVQVMSIGHLGTHGQPFEENAIERVAELHAMYPNLTIGVDGGVSEENILRLKQAGASRLVVGSALFNSPDILKQYDVLTTVVDSE